VLHVNVHVSHFLPRFDVAATMSTKSSAAEGRVDRSVVLFIGRDDFLWLVVRLRDSTEDIPLLST